MLDFARPIKFELGPADLNALCEDAARAVDTDGAPYVSLDLDRHVPPITTDAERLRLALVNILTNARHAVTARQDGQPTDPIRLKTLSTNGRVVVNIRDRGVGIAPEDLSRAFDPYFTTRRTGTGIGLAISRNIIEGLGGTIALSSRPGEGTEVRLELPIKSDGR